jgi:hypothetical protein
MKIGASPFDNLEANHSRHPRSGNLATGLNLAWRRCEVCVAARLEIIFQTFRSACTSSLSKSNKTAEHASHQGMRVAL